MHAHALNLRAQAMASLKELWLPKHTCSSCCCQAAPAMLSMLAV